MEEFASQEFEPERCSKCSRYIKHKVIYKGNTIYLCNSHYKLFAKGKMEHKIRGGDFSTSRGDKGLSTVSAIGNHLISRSGDTDVVQLRMKDLERRQAEKRKADAKADKLVLEGVEEDKALWRSVAIMWKAMNPKKTRKRMIVTKNEFRYFRIHWGNKYILYSDQTGKFTDKTDWEPRMEVDRYNRLVRYI